MMNAEQVSQKIHGEINGDWVPAFWSGVDLRQCLLSQPIQDAFLDGSASGEIISLWLVLEEQPQTHNGYQVVYDGKEDRFGLAYKNTLVGFYGSFLQTLRAM